MKKKKKKIFKILLIVTSLVILLISFRYDAYTYDNFDGKASMPSLQCFLMGSTAILGGGTFEWLIWLANPICLISIYHLILDNEKAVKFVTVALIISASFSLWTTILTSESGRTGKILSLESGYYIWLLSILILTIGTFFYFKSIKK